MQIGVWPQQHHAPSMHEHTLYSKRTRRSLAGYIHNVLGYASAAKAACTPFHQTLNLAKSCKPSLALGILQLNQGLVRRYDKALQSLLRPAAHG